MINYLKLFFFFFYAFLQCREKKNLKRPKLEVAALDELICF